ncbi:hypothetical protein WKH57_01650 [Niallia taxi]|uniref:hypothetical protein n=1 Tax=Niallia taxi TaxID=2499688 RepID=UPI00316DE56B
MEVLKEFQTTKELLEYVLDNFPETRNSDTKLYITSAKLRGAKTLDDLDKINLNLISVHKLRQKIQNKEGKYQADPEVKYIREERAKEIKKFMVN